MDAESWTMKKAERWRTAFKVWYWRRLLRVPWTARRSNSLGEVMLKLQSFGHLMRRADSLEKTLMLGKTEGKKRRGWQRMRWLDGILTQWTGVWANSGRLWRTGKPGVWQSMGLQRDTTEQLKNNNYLCQLDLFTGLHRPEFCYECKSQSTSVELLDSNGSLSNFSLHHTYLLTFLIHYLSSSYLRAFAHTVSLACFFLHVEILFALPNPISKTPTLLSVLL